MKTALPLSLLAFLFLGFSLNSQAQCDDLFFSEYVEGSANNKALEIYNPTNAAINLSEYGIARYSNGATSLTYEPNPQATFIQLPDEMIQPGGTYVVTIDRTEVSAATTSSNFDQPVWNGYMVVGPKLDDDGNVVLDENGDEVLEVQLSDTFNALFDLSDNATYYEQFDLQGRTDAFLCSDYDINNAMSFNGNDAVALIHGTEVAADISNIVDVIGVIGDNPVDTIEEDAWVDENGFEITKDQTQVRRANITQGRNNPEDIAYQLGGTFVGEEWKWRSKNYFGDLGWHKCDCQPTGISDVINKVAVNVYPNPANSQIFVQGEKAIQNISIQNVLGQQVTSKNFDANTNEVQMAVDQLSAGVYTVQVRFQNNELSVKKLIIK